MTSKHLIPSSIEEDEFGFVAVDGTPEPEESIEVIDLKLQNEVLQRQLQQMYNSIIPLLRNLNKDTEKDYIHWPDRAAKIVKFKKKIDSIGGANIQVELL